MIYIDTSDFLAVFDWDDSNHKSVLYALRWSKSITRGNMHYRNNGGII